MKKWIVFWVTVIVGLYGVYVHTIPKAQTYWTEIGTKMEVIGHR